MQSRTKRMLCLLGCLFAIAIVAVGFGIKARVKAKETKAAIPAGQVIASIKTAVAAKPGNVLEMEAENEAGKLICEIEILAQDGKTYEVAVDVATNTVVEVEADDDDDEDKDGN